MAALFSMSTGAIGADLSQIPNQPTRFLVTLLRDLIIF
jgi:hypothetical protein